MATYRRAAQDIAEVEYIVSLIDADVATNLTKWSEAADVKTITQRLLTQRKWQDILASLLSEPSNEPEPPADRVGSFGTRGEAPQPKPKSTRGGDAKPKDATE